jgi:hypothetical protein
MCAPIPLGCSLALSPRPARNPARAAIRAATAPARRGTTLPSASRTPGNVIVGDQHGGDRAVNDGNAARRQLRGGSVVQGRPVPIVANVFADVAN